MNRNWYPVILGSFLAIAVTTTMDATGYAMFSALALLPLFLLFWWWQKFPAAEIGFKWGAARLHVIAVAYPIVLMSILAAAAFLSGAADPTATDWNKALLNLALMTVTTILVTIVTEEGFFRGWLWAGLQKAGQSETRTLVISSLVFTAWHISAISLDTGFDVPLKQIPVYLVNATLLGLCFGVLRLASGSIVVSSVCHGVWNGLAYTLFGFGEHHGALGIKQTLIYGPEVGLLGILLNLAVLGWLWRTCKS